MVKKKPSTQDDAANDVESPDPRQEQETQQQQEQPTQSSPVTMEDIAKMMQMMQEMQTSMIKQMEQSQTSMTKQMESFQANVQKQQQSWQHEQEARTNPTVRQNATKAANEHTAQVAQDPSTNRTPPAHVYVTS
eukprot:CAMPEP_0118892708 /NCGR_PEP_ID=MMETSP1166-20130328/2201_1 /TAXON_ID=1104430 /ORGANISM="Chrysoreinhardia sp, Strain CCMP3193" /LENGTH=133 /DNA_ID=CAMNT_0006831453 /DNA_START=96 /DNA_END=493 /DNA_ORIENTATION=+